MEKEASLHKKYESYNATIFKEMHELGLSLLYLKNVT